MSAVSAMKKLNEDFLVNRINSYYECSEKPEDGIKRAFLADVRLHNQSGNRKNLLIGEALINYIENAYHYSGYRGGCHRTSQLDRAEDEIVAALVGVGGLPDNRATHVLDHEDSDDWGRLACFGLQDIRHLYMALTRYADADFYTRFSRLLMSEKLNYMTTDLLVAIECAQPLLYNDGLLAVLVCRVPIKNTLWFSTKRLTYDTSCPVDTVCTTHFSPRYLLTFQTRVPVPPSQRFNYKNEFVFWTIAAVVSLIACLTSRV